MRAKIQKGGNSLAVRIPKAFAQEVGRKYTLEELVRGITPENRHEETDFGPPVGRETL
jgi:antitoxin MazE